MLRFAPVLALALALAAGQTAVAELKVGDSIPDVELQGSDGKTYKLSDYKGKQAIVIAWFPKADTPGCTKECKSFKADGAELRKFNVVYFTASTDPLEDNVKFAKKYEFDYPILSDPEGKLAAPLGVISEPGKGRAARWTYIIGADGKIAYIEKAVKTDTHGKDVAAKLKELNVPAAK